MATGELATWLRRGQWVEVVHQTGAKGHGRATLGRVLAMDVYGLAIRALNGGVQVGEVRDLYIPWGRVYYATPTGRVGLSPDSEMLMRDLGGHGETLGDGDR